MTEVPGAQPTICDVARLAGVAPSTVSRALSKPGRVSFRTAEHIREVAKGIGYRARRIEPGPVARGQNLIAVLVADIANPVLVGLVRGAERATTEHGVTLLLIETQESEDAEQTAVARLASVVDGMVLTSSRLTDRAIRAAARTVPLVVLNRSVPEVVSVTSDNVRAIKKAGEHLVGLGHREICYLAGPAASWADGDRWRGLSGKQGSSSHSASGGSAPTSPRCGVVGWRRRRGWHGAAPRSSRTTT